MNKIIGKEQIGMQYVLWFEETFWRMEHILYIYTYMFAKKKKKTRRAEWKIQVSTYSSPYMFTGLKNLLVGLLSSVTLTLVSWGHSVQRQLFCWLLTRCIVRTGVFGLYASPFFFHTHASSLSWTSWSDPVQSWSSVPPVFTSVSGLFFSFLAPACVLTTLFYYCTNLWSSTGLKWGFKDVRRILSDLKKG